MNLYNFRDISPELMSRVSFQYRIKFVRKPGPSILRFIIKELNISDAVSDQEISFLLDEHVRVGTLGEMLRLEPTFNSEVQS